MKSTVQRNKTLRLSVCSLNKVFALLAWNLGRRYLTTKSYRCWCRCRCCWRATGGSERRTWDLIRQTRVRSVSSVDFRRPVESGIRDPAAETRTHPSIGVAAERKPIRSGSGRGCGPRGRWRALREVVRSRTRSKPGPGPAPTRPPAISATSPATAAPTHVAHAIRGWHNWRLRVKHCRLFSLPEASLHEKHDHDNHHKHDEKRAHADANPDPICARPHLTDEPATLQ